MLRIPSGVSVFDYEHARGLHLTHPNAVIMPEVIANSSIPLKYSYVGRYQGIKEDVYVPAFKPKPGILQKLGIQCRGNRGDRAAAGN